MKERLLRTAVAGMAKMRPSPFPACLMYHSIGDFEPTYCVDEAHFRDHLGYLKATRRILSLSDFMSGRPLGDKDILITFDDGYLDNYEVVAKLAEDMRIPVTIFVTVGLLGGRFFRGSIPMMDAAQAREIAGLEHVEVGSHTLTHPKLARLPAGRQREEIAGSKRALEDITGREARSFCYPHGSYGQETVKLVREAGYAAAFTTGIGPMSLERPYEVRRIAVNRFSQSILPHIITEGYLKYAGLRKLLP